MFSRLTAGRFQDGEVLPLGPGAYELPSTLAERAPALKGSGRFQDSRGETPGPGTYGCTPSELSQDSMKLSMKTSPRMKSSVIGKPKENSKENRTPSSATQNTQKSARIQRASSCERASERMSELETLKRQLMQEQKLRMQAEVSLEEMSATKQAEASFEETSATEKAAVAAEAQLKMHESRVEALQKRCAELSELHKQAQRRLEDADTEEALKQKALADKERTVAQLQKSLDSAKAALEHIAKKEEKCAAVAKEKELIQQELEDQRAAFAKAQEAAGAQRLAEVQRLEADLEAKSLDNQRLTAQLVTLQAAADSAASQVQTLESKLDVQASAMRDASELHSAELARLEEAETARMGALQAKIDEMQNEMGSLRREAEEWQKKFNARKEEVERRPEEVQKLNKEAQSQQKMIQELSSSMRQLAQDNEELKSINGQLGEKLSLAEGELVKAGGAAAKLAGHKNHKQKIQHMMKIKEENEELRKECIKYQRILRMQAEIQGEGSLFETLFAQTPKRQGGAFTKTPGGVTGEKTPAHARSASCGRARAQQSAAAMEELQLQCESQERALERTRVEFQHIVCLVQRAVNGKGSDTALDNLLEQLRGKPHSTESLLGRVGSGENLTPREPPTPQVQRNILSSLARAGTEIDADMASGAVDAAIKR